MTKNKLSRREMLNLLLKGGIGGGLLLENTLGIPIFDNFSQSLASKHYPRISHDAYHNIYDALNGGISAFSLNRAMAAPDKNDWSVVHIKVLNHVLTPLVFKLGELNNNTVTSTATTVKSRSGDAESTMGSADEIAINPRFKNLRFNKWFSEMLISGTGDGKARTETNSLGLAAEDIGEFPGEEKVAMQAFLGLGQAVGVNHSLKGCKMRNDMSDIGLFLQETKLITSPLGINCFMMGGTYDKAEGVLKKNAVLTGEGETAAIASKSVSEYVSLVKQFVDSPSYADRSSIEQNVIFRLDKLITKEPKIRRELLSSVQKFKKSLIKLTSAADLETRKQTRDPLIGNVQSQSTAGATSEFLGQIKYVTNVLQMDGKPLRNFSCFLNVNDLDGDNIDSDRFKGIKGDKLEAYSYIEGMRQLAIGLNMLAKTIAKGHKLVVIVQSEGGRNLKMGDSKTAFSLVMGPGGSAGLQDMLYADMQAINKANSSIVTDGASTQSNTKHTTEGLVDASGAPLDELPNAGDVNLGVVEFLQEKTGVDALSKVTAKNARRFKLKRS